MHKTLLGFLVGVSLSVPVCAFSGTGSDGDWLHQQVSQCERCHRMDSRVSSIAPSLDGMEDGYFTEQLENFRQSRRDADSSDLIEREMSKQARDLSDEQVSRLADYYSARKRRFSRESVSGNAENGKLLYNKHCKGCHSSLLGRLFTGSPRITHLRGAYLLAQLEKFASGERQVRKDSKHKVKMVTVARQMSDGERADIVAYVKHHYSD